jgi:Phosphotransferase enzyme family
VNTATLDRSSASAAISAVPKDLYRLLLLRRNGSELLVAGGRPPFTLPCVEIPKWERAAENVIAAVSKRYGISATCLFTPERSANTPDGDQRLYQVMETREAKVAAADETSWLPANSLLNQSFADEQDFAAITDMLRQIADFQKGKTIGPFGRPGWIEELSSWVQREIEPYGLRLNGEFRQLNDSPTFALLRLETNGQAVWFKAAGEPNLREFSISVALSRLFPGFVPTVIATHPAWHGWLTTEFAGSTLDEVPDACAWKRAAQTLGELQIASVGMTDQLLEAGCRDLRVTSLLPSVDPFLEVMTQLMEQQRKTPPPALDRDELLTLGSQIKVALSELAELCIPDTLGHLDFNPGNILCSADQCVFLDWAEAYVGHPFLTLQHFREHLARLRQEDISLGAGVVSAYETKWHGILPREAVALAQDLAPALAVFAYAVGTPSWRNPTMLGEPTTAAYLRSLTRRMRIEMQRLRERGQFCCN